MEKTENGGPAFPRPAGPYVESERGVVHDGQPGMTMRDYFAAHAPTEIPDWFYEAGGVKTGNRGKPPEIPSWKDLPIHLQNFAKEWQLDPCQYDLTDIKSENLTDADMMRLDKFQSSVFEANENRIKWVREAREAVYISWRWYYADMMIAARNGEKD